MREAEIRGLKIDLDRNIIEINGKEIKDCPIMVTLPGPEGWPLSKIFNARLSTFDPEECDTLKITYKKAVNSRLL